MLLVFDIHLKPNQGEANDKKRAHLYAFILENSSELDKLQISQRICQVSVDNASF